MGGIFKGLKRRKTKKDRLKQSTSLDAFFGQFWQDENEKFQIENTTFEQVKKTTEKINKKNEPRTITRS